MPYALIWIAAYLVYVECIADEKVHRALVPFII